MSIVLPAEVDNHALAASLGHWGCSSIGLHLLGCGKSRGIAANLGIQSGCRHLSGWQAGEDIRTGAISESLVDFLLQHGDLH